MRKHLEAENILISAYSKDSSSDLYTFEAREGKKLEMVKVTTKEHVVKLLNNGFHGSNIQFEGVDSTTRKFFRQCAGIR